MNSNQKTKSGKSLLTKLLFIILLILVIATIIMKNIPTKEAINKNTFIEFPDRRVLPVVVLEQAGTEGFSTNTIKGKWHILYFGYTFCPDICPLELTTLHQMMKILREEITEPDLPQIIFISIDPDRDKPEQVKEYVSSFDKSFIGLTGKKEALETLASPFGIGWSKDAPLNPKNSNENDFYTVSHSTTLLLINPDSKVAGMFPAPHSAKDMAKFYKTIIKNEEAR